MYKLCKTESAAHRQRQLEQGLLQVMLQKPYDEITISDLCAQMEIPRKSFYRYFSGKDGALFALLDHTLLEFEQTASIRANSMNEDLGRYFTFWYEHRDLLEALRRSQLSGILADRATKFAIQEHLMPRRIMDWSPKHQLLAISFATCGLFAMILQWQSEGYRLSPKEMAQVATAMLSQPLLQP